MRTTVVRDLADYDEVVWFADVPHLPGSHAVTHQDAGSEGEWIAIERPRVPPRPIAPAELWGWLEDEAEPAEEPRLRGLVEDEVLPEAVLNTFEAYALAVREWLGEHAAKIPLVSLYQRLFRVRQQVEQLGERYELVVGAGLVMIPATQGESVRRHLVTLRAEIDFDTQSGRIVLRPAADGLQPEIEDEMLDPGLLPSREVREATKSTIEDAGVGVWEADTLPTALESWTNAMRHDAKFVPNIEAPKMPGSGVLVALAPAVVLRKRTQRSLIEFYRAIQAQLQNGAAVPDLLRGVVAEAEEHDGPEPGELDPDSDAAGDDELYFPKVYNPQQRQVLQRLETSRGVVVVGPPGTGKSHTIANLVSHLLAKGQRVLVTSHTSRALEVLLDKLPDEIRMLSVSLVGDGRAGMRELEHSVAAIVQRKADPEWQSREIDDRVRRLKASREVAEDERRRLLAIIREVRETDAREHDLGFGGYTGSLSEIARRLDAERPRLAWASGMTGNQPALDDGEALDLLELNRSLTADDESLAGSPVPDLDDMPPELFAPLCARREELVRLLADLDALLAHPAAPALARASREERLALVSEIGQLESARAHAAEGEPWETAAFEVVLGGSAADWRSLDRRTHDWISSLREIEDRVDRVSITGALRADEVRARALTLALLEHLQSGGRWGIGPFRPAAVRAASAALGSVMVNGTQPKSPESLQDLIAWLDFRLLRAAATEAWAAYRDLGQAGPGALVDHLDELAAASSRVLVAEQCRRGVLAALDTMPGLEHPAWREVEAWSELKRAAGAVDAEAELGLVDSRLGDLQGRITEGPGDSDELSEKLRVAIDAHDAHRYAELWKELLDRREIVARVRRRDELGQRLAQALPTLTLDVLAVDADDWTTRFRAFGEAFWWSKAERWLRSALDASTGGAAARVSALTEQIRALTAQIGEHLAWSSCLGALTYAQLQHLTLYQQAMRKYGRGTGKYAPRHLAAARHELEACRAAVPAWIMPTYRVVESIRPDPQAFDVVIVDEASQSGIDALFLWWLGKKLVIVGDDEQISPDAVGMEQEPFFTLRDELIDDTPIGGTISPTTSLFDLGQVAFPGQKTYLREHFRCMPEIIAFSNKISYANAPLEPLRQFGGDRLAPLVERHVTGAVKTEGARWTVNREEAHALVEAIRDVARDPRYEGRTLGVISLIGEVQARYIERLLVQELGPDEILRRRLKCGDAYAFQGDERDVMFLSMVSVPTDKGNRLPAMTADMYRRRFNVAASRARDQMWLFHSVSPADLNPECLRAKLLGHFLHPPDEPGVWQIDGVLDSERHPAFDSLFEQRVYLRIRSRGYAVLPQVQAYGYSIDLVVVGGNTRLAVECDGDEWHGAEQFERDLARQRDLERVGWRFVRIRESEFYLEPDAALAPLWRRLAEVGIRPSGGFEEIVPASDVPTPAESPTAGIASEESEDVVRAILAPFGPATAPETTLPVPAAPMEAAIRGAEGATAEALAVPVPPPSLATAPYVAWRARRLEDPRRAQRRELADALVEVVAAEGPVLAHRAYRLLVQAAGGQRLTHAAVSPLNKACALADREGRLVAVQSPIRGGVINSLLRLPAQPEVVVRTRGPRSLEEIPWGEIQAIARRLRRDRPALVADSLMRAILENYDRVALTEAARRYLDTCLAAVVSPHDVVPDEAAKRVPVVIPPAARTSGRLGPAVLPAGRDGSPPDFAKVLANFITRAQALGPAARAALAAGWTDSDVSDQRNEIVQAAALRGAPADWTVAARAVTATLGDFSANARAAIVDAAYAEVADGPATDAQTLLRPWRSAIAAEASPSVSRATVAQTDDLRCPHGRPLSMCTMAVCRKRFLGSTFDEDWRSVE